jgi:hypothetical protein
MNLEQMIAEDLGKQFADNMDFEILADVMCRFGWHMIELDRYTDNHHAIDVREWVIKNCSGEHLSHGATWVFENTADAVIFKLKWGS